MTLKEIVKQLEACKFKCEAGSLETNVAFIELKKMAEGKRKMYRVYEICYAEDGSESGIYEYGFYSSLTQAQRRLEEVWNEKKYPLPTQKSDFEWYSNGFCISIDEFSIDADIGLYSVVRT
jgi:hypothetical protein